MARTKIDAYDMGAGQLTGRIFNGNSDTGQADGYYVQNNGDLILLVTKSATNGPITIQTGGVATGGDAIADRDYTITSTDTVVAIGPFPPGECNQKGGNNLWIDFEGSEETEFEVVALKVPKQR